ncbi:MAG TPA: single-stranded-DNA-specific exonuclease RecJ [Solirubrobacteraceae bacterium]|nr:single-stranded-DNA-specific exonuclease RecJ [Solirubrobacteraceae bacterium]
MQSVRFEIPDCPPQAVDRLRSALGIGDVLAQTLVRRGIADAGAAADFLGADRLHDHGAFVGIEQAVEPILRRIAQGGRITVHGDYDVDGVCSTALLVSALRRLSGQVDWHIPARAAGYGLREDAVRAIAERGTELLITVDCGIASVAEVALAQSLGMQVVVTDHHSPRADGALPEAPIVHPRLCGYPCPDLCGTAVAHKLTRALWSAAGRDPAELDADLDLVALASIADVVDLLGENRALTSMGLKALAATTRPGLRALMEVARIDPSRIDARMVAFGLAPRINAPGRLFTAAAPLELLMTVSSQRAAELAQELDRCNRERRQVEQRILFEAQAQVRELGELPGYVLAGEGWHPGVVGIVASRIVEATNRPAVLVGLDGAGGRGSGRSIEGFDLLGGLSACSEHLLAYGGHRAACGLELVRERLEGFREAFARHAELMIDAEALVATERVDAIVSVADVGLPLAEELSRLAPFGRGNPTVCLMVRDAEVAQVQAMGEGKHARFKVLEDSSHAAAVSFGNGATLPVQEGEPIDATFTLEINEWRGACEPRLVLRQIAPAAAEAPSVSAARTPIAIDQQPLQLALAVP